MRPGPAARDPSPSCVMLRGGQNAPLVAYKAELPPPPVTVSASSCLQLVALAEAASQAAEQRSHAQGSSGERTTTGCQDQLSQTAAALPVQPLRPRERRSRKVVKTPTDLQRSVQQGLQ